MITFILFIAGLVFYFKGEKERAKNYLLWALLLQLIAILLRFVL